MLAVEGIGAVVLAVPPVATVYHFSEVPDALSAAAAAPSQRLSVAATTGAAGRALTFTAMDARKPSQPPAEDWLTYQVVVPAAVVDGVGADASAVPPLATVYHFKEEPVAVSAVAASPTQ